MTPVGYLDTGVLYCDDNLHRLSEFPSECVDLIYLDPPFFSNRHYEVIWGDEAEVRSFEDRWEGGIQVYINWMRERILEMHRILRPTGSIYLHCDWHAAHYIKQMLDDVFGDNRFQNEVIWYYKGAGVSPKRWARRHDNIFFYTKGNDWYFNPDPVRGEYAEATKERFKHYIGNKRGKHDFGVQELNPKGKHPDDVWEISIVAPSAKERLGYPTQKPEPLLDRIILASSKPGDIVLDPFAGCGTTLVSAQKNKRQWIGIDISPTAVELMKRRMERVGAIKIKLIGMPVSEAQLLALKPFEFQNWVIQRLNGTHSPRRSGDMGIDGFSFLEHLPIQVKQSEHVGRQEIDKFETAIERSGRQKGYMVAFSFTRNAYEEVARALAKNDISIELIAVKDLLADAAKLVTPDAATDLFGEDLPLPGPRPPGSRPSVEELVKSDQASKPKRD